MSGRAENDHAPRVPFMAFPTHAKYVVIGAGIHGLSTAWHLAENLRKNGKGGGKDILVLDKTGIAAGASGIACGVIRNNYFQPAMRELMAHSVGIWESDPDAFSYHPVGYLQISPEAMRADVTTIYEQQRAIGYPSTFVEGTAEARRYMQRIFPDWRAQNVTSVLHEHRGGYANNTASMRGLARKAEAEGVRIIPGVRVTGFYRDNGAVTRVQTGHGDIRCGQVIVAAGPWVRDLWRMLDLPQTVKIRDPHGEFHLRSTWTYWSLRRACTDPWNARLIFPRFAPTPGPCLTSPRPTSRSSAARLRRAGRALPGRQARSPG